MVSIVLKERSLKLVRAQMVFKMVSQLGQFGREVIVTDSTAGLFPDLFLRVQFGRSDGIFHDLQTRIGRQQTQDRLTVMPGGAIPEEQNRLLWKSIQYLLQMAGRRFGIEHRRAGHHFMTRFQVQRAVEARFAATRIHANNRCLTAWRPNVHGGGLQIHPGFVLRQNHGFRRILGDVDQFFSTNASKSITAAVRCDLYTFSVRW
jgi:hypothetical protein